MIETLITAGLTLLCGLWGIEVSGLYSSRTTSSMIIKIKYVVNLTRQHLGHIVANARLQKDILTNPLLPKEGTMNKKFFQCFKICECDSNGEFIYGLINGKLVKASELTEEMKPKVRWGSASCSKCGQIALIKDGGY